MNPLMRRLLPLFLLVALVLPIACGGDSSDSTAAGETARAGADFEAEVGSTIEVPQGPAPKKLVIEDLKKGSGPVAQSGDEVEILYVDALYKSGEVVSLAVPGAPFHFELGAEGSVPGWEKGVVGMSVGGQRELIIPAALADGAEAHVSLVELVGIR
ncbi:MAG TPA: FKBP-type peptidyl-prolyl cis-trans isomerase [Solirubrobacterales bacterium]|nr:FKBP-type peptidyl-prolyl cis-trans isomerase [Solirubrobacterales bacterium]